MKISSITQVFAIPLAAATAVVAYVSYIDRHDSLSYYLFPLIISLVLLYLFKPQIDFWYHTKYPLPLDEEMRDWLLNFFPFYEELSEEDKIKFETRLNLYLEGRSFELVVQKDKKEVPEDTKAMIAANMIMLTFNQEDYLLGDFDRVYFYLHPFPTPKNQFLHTTETNLEDGVLIVTLDYAMQGIANPKGYYNLALHTCIDAFIKHFPSFEYPEMEEADLPDLELVSGFKNEDVKNVLGYPSIDYLLLMINYYFVFPSKFQSYLPDKKKKLDLIFRTETDSL